MSSTPHPDASPRPLAAALAVVAWCLATALLLPGVVRGSQTLITDGDSADQSVAWLSKVFAATRSGTVALWDFTTMSGTSFIGELQTAPLYPVAVAAGLVIPPGDRHGIDLFLLLHFVLAAVGMQWSCRALGLSTMAGLVGAAVFAFGSTVAIRVSGQPNLFASLAWTPWIHWTIVRASRAAGPADATACLSAGGAVVALAFLAGHVHGLVFALMGGVVMALAAPTPTLFRAGVLAAILRVAAVLIVMGIVAAALAAPQLAATVEYLRLSYKWYGPGHTEFPHIVPYECFAAGTLQAADLWTLWSGQEVRAIDGGTLFVTRTGAALALVAIGSAVLPGVGRGVAGAGAIVAATGLAFACAPALGLGSLFYALPGFNLVRTPARGLFLYAAGMAVLAAVGVDRLQHLARIVTPSRTAAPTVVAALVLASAAFEIHAWLPPRVRRDAGDPRTQVEALLHGPTGGTLQALAGAAPRHRFYAPRELVPPNLGNVRFTLSAHGYRSTRTKVYHDDFSFNPLDPRLDRYAIRWWVSADPVPGLPVVHDLGTGVIQERPGVPPVFRLADHRHADRFDRAPIAWGHNHVRLRLPIPVSGRLLFAQPWYPGWVARVDGRVMPVQEDDGVMAIDVAEASDVTVEYAPAWWWPTVLLSMTALAAVVACPMLARRRWPRRPMRTPQ